MLIATRALSFYLLSTLALLSPPGSAIRWLLIWWFAVLIGHALGVIAGLIVLGIEYRRR